MSRGDGCIIDIAGDEVRLVDGHGLTIATTRGWRFTIDGPATWTLPDAAPARVERAADPSVRPRLGALAGRRLESVAAFVDGRLELDFVDGARLVAEPAVVNEAWQAVGPRGTRITSLAGGALALSR